MGKKCESGVRDLINLRSNSRALIEAVNEREEPRVLEDSVETLKNGIEESEFIPENERRELLDSIRDIEGNIKDLKSPRTSTRTRQKTWSHLETEATSLGNDFILDGPTWASEACQEAEEE